MQSLHVSFVDFLQPLTSGARSLLLGIKELDNLLCGLRQGDFIVFHGSQMCHVISEQLCVRSQLPHADGGLDSSVVFIDGGNLFDPHLISETARLLGLNPEKTLRNIWISRAFTCYQMVALITERLQPFLDQKDPSLVVISDIASLFCDSDIGISEAKRTFNRLILSLWTLVKERNIVLMVYSLSSRSQRKRRLEQYLLERADIVVGIEDGNPHVKITLEKHPFRPLTSTELCFEEPNFQSQL